MLFRSTGLAPRRSSVLGECGAELVAPAADRLVRDHDAPLEQQFFDVAQAQAEPEIPANRAADDHGVEAVSMVKRFRLLHRFILPLPEQHQLDGAVGTGSRFAIFARRRGARRFTKLELLHPWP